MPEIPHPQTRRPDSDAEIMREARANAAAGDFADGPPFARAAATRTARFLRAAKRPRPPLSVAAASRALSSRRSGGDARHGASGFSALRFSGSSAVRRRRRDVPAPFRRNPVRRIGTAANGPHRTCEAADAVNTTISVRVKKRGLNQRGTPSPRTYFRRRRSPHGSGAPQTGTRQGNVSRLPPTPNVPAEPPSAELARAAPEQENVRMKTDVFAKPNAEPDTTSGRSGKTDVRSSTVSTRTPGSGRTGSRIASSGIRPQYGRSEICAAPVIAAYSPPPINRCFVRTEPFRAQTPGARYLLGV